MDERIGKRLGVLSDVLLIAGAVLAPVGICLESVSLGLFLAGVELVGLSFLAGASAKQHRKRRDADDS